MKGRPSAGCDADLVVFDPDAAFVVEAGGLHRRHKLPPYLGRTLHGVVRRTLVRGRAAFDAGTFASPSGSLTESCHGIH